MTRRLCVAALVVGTLLFSWRHLFFRGQIPIDGNMIRMGYPNWTFARAPFGAIPLWNPYRNMGEPFLADPQTMAGYPVHWLLAPRLDFLNFMRGWVLVHSLLAAFFMGCLAFRWYEDGWAAAAAAATIALNGFFASRVTLPNHFAALAWMPAVLFFAEERRPVLLGCALAFQWLAGFPPFSVLTGLAALLITAGQPRRLSGWMIGGCVALGLAAFQWIPFVELLAHSTRPIFLHASTALDNSESVRGLLKMCFVPEWYGFRPEVTGDQAIVSFYVGSALLLAALGVFWGGRREKRLALVALAGLVLSVGGHLPSGAYLRIFDLFRFPANWLLLTTAGVALLAGAGVAQLPDRNWKAAALGLLILDLAGFAQYVRVPWVPPELLEHTPPLAQAMKDPAAGRLYHTPIIPELYERQGWRSLHDFALMKAILAPSLGMAFGVREVTSYQVLAVKEAGAYQSRLYHEGPASPLARWAGISTVVTLVPDAREIQEKTIKIVALQSPEAPVFFPQAVAGNRVVKIDQKPGFLEASISGAGEGQSLVFSEVDYPGWQLSVDGASRPHEKFEGTFLSARVPAGFHDVVFRFRPKSFLVGRWISLGSFLGLAIIAL